MAISSGILNSSFSHKEAITLGIAIVGAVLGILNLLRDIYKTRRQSQIQVKIIPKLGFIRDGCMISNMTTVPDPSAFLVVEVINNSYFPIFVQGLYLVTEVHKYGECFVSRPLVTSDKSLPLKLERHESATLYAPPQTVRELILMGARAVYIKTSSNQRFEGTSKIFKILRDQHRQLSKVAARTS